jgi:HD-like signal output (HDOD) protein
MSHTLSASTLEDLVPVHRLDRDQRAYLAQYGQISTIGAGKKLIATQENPWLDYLLAGKACLVKGDHKEVIEAGTMRACQPLFSADRLRDSVILLEEGELLRLDRQLYEQLSGEPGASSKSIDELELSDTESALLGEFCLACKAGKLALPALPKVARAILDAMNDPTVSSVRLARLVQMDLAVTGGLIRLANSVMYRGSKPINDVRNAIIRLGQDVTRSVVMSMAMQQVFKTKSPMMKQRMKAIWNRSVRVSALSYVIARHCTGSGSVFQPEQALLAGLLHDVGVIPILDFVSRNYHEIDDVELEATILKLRTLVGELVVGYWGLGPEIVQVVRESGNWHRDAGDKPDYCDIVLVARLYRMNQGEALGPLPGYEDVPAYFKLGLGFIKPGETVDMIGEASEELDAVVSMLRGTGS